MGTRLCCAKATNNILTIAGIIFIICVFFSGNIDPVPGNHYELENEEPVPGDGAYDSVGPVGASGSKSKPPAGNTLPPVYAAVDKNNRQGNTVREGLTLSRIKLGIPFLVIVDQLLFGTML